MFFKKKGAKKQSNKNKNQSKNKKTDKRTSVKRDHGIKEKKVSRILTAPRSIMLPRLLLITSVIVLCVFGIVFVYSASSVKGYVEHNGNASYFVIRQLIFMFISLIPSAVIIFIKYKFFDRKYISLICWIGCVCGLILVLVAGVSALGAERAIFIGPFAIQPAEFTKIMLMLFLSHLISERYENRISGSLFMLVGVGAIFLTLLLVFRQPDLGTIMIICIGVLVLLILGRFPWQLIIGIIAGVLLIFILVCVLQPYHLNRIKAVLDPYSDPDGSGYQLIHSLYAFGTGGIFGTGLGASRQKYLYLPEAHTDFIFAIIGEEAGLIGALFIVLAFATFVYAGLMIARNAPDLFGRLVAGSLTCVVGFQAVVNMACVVGLAPITGKPLPFLSYGGSSMMSSMAIAAFILSISLNSSPDKRYQEKRDKLVIFSRSPRNVQQNVSGGVLAEIQKTSAVAEKASGQAIKAGNKVLDIFKRFSKSSKGATQQQQNRSYDIAAKWHREDVSKNGDYRVDNTIQHNDFRTKRVSQNQNMKRFVKFGRRNQATQDGSGNKTKRRFSNSTTRTGYDSEQSSSKRRRSNRSSAYRDGLSKNQNAYDNRNYTSHNAHSSQQNMRGYGSVSRNKAHTDSRRFSSSNGRMRDVEKHMNNPQRGNAVDASRRKSGTSRSDNYRRS